MGGGKKLKKSCLWATCTQKIACILVAMSGILGFIKAKQNELQPSALQKV